MNDIPFPTLAWFNRLAELMKEDRALHEHLGDVECVAQFTVTDARPNGAPWSAQVTFDGFEVTDLRVVDERAEDAADFVVDEVMWNGYIADGRAFGLDGKSGDVSFRLLHVFDIADGKITREAVWCDLAAIQAQLG